LSFGARLTGPDSYRRKTTQGDRTLAQSQLPNRRNVPLTGPPIAEPALDIEHANAELKNYVHCHKRPDARGHY
jgi:hypothetical protein